MVRAAFFNQPEPFFGSQFKADLIKLEIKAENQRYFYIMSLTGGAFVTIKKSQVKTAEKHSSPYNHNTFIVTL